LLNIIDWTLDSNGFRSKSSYENPPRLQGLSFCWLFFMESPNQVAIRLLVCKLVTFIESMTVNGSTRPIKNALNMRNPLAKQS